MFSPRTRRTEDSVSAAWLVRPRALCLSLVVRSGDGCDAHHVSCLGRPWVGRGSVHVGVVLGHVVSRQHGNDLASMSAPSPSPYHSAPMSAPSHPPYPNVSPSASSGAVDARVADRVNRLISLPTVGMPPPVRTWLFEELCTVREVVVVAMPDATPSRAILLGTPLAVDHGCGCLVSLS